jgi:DNA-binding CsgD family transcriptional regulator
MASTAQAQHASLVDRIYDAVLQPDGWGGVLTEAMRVFRASSAALFVQNLGTRRPELGVSTGLSADKAIWARFYDYYVFKNPVRLANLSQPVGEPTASNLLMPDEEFEQLEYHRDFQKSVGCFYEMATHLVRDDRMLACFSVQREKAEGGFSSEDVEGVRTLHPHLRRAMLLRHRIGEQTAAAQSMEQALHALSTPMCLLGADGRVAFSNTAAELIIAEGSVLRLKAGVLSPTQPGDQAIWQRWLASITGNRMDAPLADGRLALRGRDGAVALHIWASPFRVPTERTEKKGVPGRIALFLSRPGASPAVSPGRLQEFFGLTPAETRVLHGLVNGKTPKEVAAEAGLSAETVRAQIKSIYEKLEVHRQAELMQRVLLSPAVLVQDGR